MRRALGLLLMLMVALPGTRARAQDAAPGKGERPTLVVLLSVDQLAGWVLRSVEPWLGEGGFRRLAREGTSFPLCSFAHAATYTGPGHATLATGALPGAHGIVGNNWWDRNGGSVLYCAGDRGVKAAVGVSGGAASSPRNLLAPTLGDTMKAHLERPVRVVSLSWKDRSAVLMGGHGADVVAWMNKATGQFVTSTWYGEKAADWLTAFNATRPAHAWFKKTWDRMGPVEAYAALTDDRPLERPVVKGRRTLPKVLDGAEDAPAPSFYRQLYTSPFGNDLIIAAAEAALTGMQLGKGPGTDMLCLGFSSNDAVGHAFGPLSHEVRDITLRTDAQLARLLEMLDQRVGKERYMIIVSGDHGIAPSPDSLRALRGPVKKGFVTRKASQAAERALTNTFGEPPEGFKRWVEKAIEFSLYLDHRALAAARLDLVKAQDVASRAVLEVPGIAAAVGLERALRGQIPPHDVHQSLRRTAHPTRSGDVCMAVAPYWVGSPLTVAAHGAPYVYDRVVPLMIKGPGIKESWRSPASVTPGAGVVIAAWLLRIPKPALAHDTVPLDVFE